MAQEAGAKSEYKQTSEPMIELGKNEEVRTLGRYGQVTLIMEEEQSFGD